MNMVYSFFQSLLKSPAGVLIITLFCLLQTKATNSATAFLHHPHQQRHHHVISYAPLQRRAVVSTTTNTARHQLSSSSSLSWLFPTFTKPSSTRRGITASKARLLELIMTSSTEASVTTTEILELVREIEVAIAEQEKRITAQDILNKLDGQWELLWTVQDPESIHVMEKQGKGGSSRLNLLENQRPKVVNNQLDNDKSQGGGGGGLQVLQTLASIVNTNNKKETKNKKKVPRRSTQEISIDQQQVRNVAYYSNVFGGSGDNDISITVDIDFKPHNGSGGGGDGDDIDSTADPRRIDAEFTSCRVIVPQTPIDFSLPLQVFGGRPRGWLRTTYVDDDFRITRGHKGSIFILCRPPPPASP